MPEQTIIIEIDEDGQIHAGTEGFSGDMCMSALQDLLGADEIFSHVEPTAEFYQGIGENSKEILSNRRS